eukprot:4329380-Alexandrium_andersonii.AAC.1
MAPRALSDEALVGVPQGCVPVAGNSRALAAGEELAFWMSPRAPAATAAKKARTWGAGGLAS